GRHQNELTRFRYDVFVHVESRGGAAPPPSWLDWREDGLRLADLQERLASGPPVLGVRGVPNARLEAAAKALDWLAGGEDGPQTLEGFRQAIAAQPGEALEPEALCSIAEEHGYGVELGYAGGGSKADMDVLYRKRGTVRPGEVFWAQPANRVRKPWAAYANNPLKAKLVRDLTPRLRDYLAEALPEYMVPSAIVVLDELPLTPNGKVDRRALPAPGRARLKAAYVAPRTRNEEILSGIWAEVLKLDRLGVEDDFFDLGGHSLLAMQVVSRMRQAFGVELPLRELFAAPTIAGLGAWLEALRADPPPVPAAPPLVATEPGPAELSFSQQRLWMLDQIEPGGTAYVMSGALELAGVLDVPALERTLEALVNRHESLRTVFVSVEGKPQQVVSEPRPRALPVADLGGEASAGERLGERLRAEAARGFDLARGPLFRAQLYRLAADRHVLLLTMHHIISDGWSLGVLTRELGEFYRSFARGEAPGLPALRVQYRDYARWQRGWLQGEVLASQLARWRERLAGAPQVLELPTDRARPAAESFRGALHSFMVPLELTDALRALARNEGSTLFMLLLSAYALLLARYSGQKDLLIGTAVANRHPAEVEPLVGFFVNTLVLRADLSGEPSVREFLGRMREMCLDALAHQDLPFERLVEELRPERDMSRNPVFQVMFTLQNAPMGPLELPGLTLNPVDVGVAAAQFDLSLLAEETPEGLTASFTYATDLFDATTIARMGAHWRALLEAMVAEPGRRVFELMLLSERERRQLLVEWNDTKTDYPREKCVHELFGAQAACTPDAVAVACGNQRLTYRELDARSSQLARFLQERGVVPDTLVPICVERSLEMVIGLLGILKAGGAYVPLDPIYPADRLGFMLEDTEASLLLTQAHLLPKLPGRGATTICLDTEWHELANLPRTSPASRTNSGHLAYVIYTSGSTGRPKGVCITHRGLVNYLSFATGAYEVAQGTGAPVHSSIAFDLTVTSLFAPLL
ncbi:MAG TPA: condensation domain-containing protein, partial [Pseudomonadales bacterium]|nr:condensation domain-containing protein [Pseudomonadales bacterium]